MAVNIKIYWVVNMKLYFNEFKFRLFFLKIFIFIICFIICVSSKDILPMRQDGFEIDYRVEAGEIIQSGENEHSEISVKTENGIKLSDKIFKNINRRRKRLNGSGSFIEENPLWHAYYDCNFQEVERLKKNGEIGSVDMLNNKGYCPLWVACLVADIEKVKKLVAAGADVNKVGIDGRTPLAVAYVRGNFEIVDFLKTNGAQEVLDLIDLAGYTPLMRVLLVNNFKTAKTLILRGADVDKTDNKGISTIYFVNNIELLGLLLEYEAVCSQKIIDLMDEPKINSLLNYVYNFDNSKNKFNFLLDEKLNFESKMSKRDHFYFVENNTGQSGLYGQDSFDEHEKYFKILVNCALLRFFRDFIYQDIGSGTKEDRYEKPKSIFQNRYLGLIFNIFYNFVRPCLGADEIDFTNRKKRYCCEKDRINVFKKIRDGKNRQIYDTDLFKLYRLDGENNLNKLDLEKISGVSTRGGFFQFVNNFSAQKGTVFDRSFAKIYEQDCCYAKNLTKSRHDQKYTDFFVKF